MPHPTIQINDRLRRRSRPQYSYPKSLFKDGIDPRPPMIAAIESAIVDGLSGSGYWVSTPVGEIFHVSCSAIEVGDWKKIEYQAANTHSQSWRMRSMTEECFIRTVFLHPTENAVIDLRTLKRSELISLQILASRELRLAKVEISRMATARYNIGKFDPQISKSLRSKGRASNTFCQRLRPDIQDEWSRFCRKKSWSLLSCCKSKPKSWRF